MAGVAAQVHPRGRLRLPRPGLRHRLRLRPGRRVARLDGLADRPDRRHRGPVRDRDGLHALEGGPAEAGRSEERRVGKECRSRRSTQPKKKKDSVEYKIDISKTNKTTKTTRNNRLNEARQES